jgi:hypothetical protein
MSVLETLITRIAEIISQMEFLNVVMPGWCAEVTRIIVKKHQSLDGEVIQEFNEALQGLVDYAIQDRGSEE